MFARRKPTIEFLCSPEDQGVLAPPVPAKEVMPDWFKRLPAIDKSQLTPTNNALTVKRCMPFIDALTTGWILPLAATVRLEVRDEGRTVNAGWDFDRVMVSNHNSHQVAGNPREPRPPSKFHNYWTIRTPPGWSCLFVPPLNRPNPVVEVVAGIVDTDNYVSLIHFPFFAVAADGMHTLEKGTPLVQIIPFERAGTGLPGEIKVETPADAAARQRILRNTQAGDGWYRKFARAPR
jgi:Family of unknown function (DUF6065)